MEDIELVFITAPTISHLVAEVELAKHLVAQDPRISVAVLVPKLPVPDSKVDAYIQSAPLVDDGRISLIELPQLGEVLLGEEWRKKRPAFLFNLLATLYKPVVKSVVDKRRRRTVGILTDMLMSQMVDVAEELRVSSYVLYTSGANLLSMMLQLESLAIDVPSAFGKLPSESIPLEIMHGYRNPVPLKVWPEIILDKVNSTDLLLHAKRYRRTQGILVNTFMELETELLRSLSDDGHCPPVYPVGPILSQKGSTNHPMLSWLDAQPQGSVVFLCFGTNGSFGKQQVEQMALGIERSGQRFLWSLRRQPFSDNGERLATDYEDLEDVLPTGFVERTAGMGRTIGWAPQAQVLAHPAVGAFVSHCGWNSVLESLWFGVPVVAWPMYAEQQLNAFLLVRELGIAVELRMDYRFDLAERKGNVVVTAEEVEAGIRRMMEEEEGARVRKKVKEMSESAKKALDFGGSSTKSLGTFIEELIRNS